MTDGVVGSDVEVLGDRRTAQKRSQPRFKGPCRPLIIGRDPVPRTGLWGYVGNRGPLESRLLNVAKGTVVRRRFVRRVIVGNPDKTCA